MKNKIYIICVVLATNIFTNFSQQQTERFLINNIKINNEFQNFGTTFFGQNQVIYSSQSKLDGYLHLHKGKIDNEGQIINSKKLEDINSKFHESNVVFSNNESKVYFSRSISGKINTIHSNKDQSGRIDIISADVTASGKWENPKSLPFGNKNYDIAHPTVSKDGKKMYFTSNMPGTLGLTDIFVVAIQNDGTFGVPKNMGPKVNSRYSEMFPYVDDNNILFFSSNRPNGYGGLDIYAVKQYENGDISEKLHLEPPINSIHDDFNYIFNESKKVGYFSSNRSTGKGSDDIYFFTETRPLIFDCFQTINGIVVDQQSKKPIPYAIVTYKDATGLEIKKITTERDGKFSFDLATCDTGYEIFAEKKYYTNNFKKITTSVEHKGETFITITLTDDFIVRKRGKQMLNIDVINFDFDSALIRPDAANQLNRVVSTMIRYPRMVIELGTHTDARGKDLYNLVLSSKRARSVIKYIVNQGIAQDRISGKGYGEKRLLNQCKNGVKCTESEHEKNRRSEFVITRI